jgi:hypothetical protein
VLDSTNLLASAPPPPMGRKCQVLLFANPLLIAKWNHHSGDGSPPQGPGFENNKLSMLLTVEGCHHVPQQVFGKNSILHLGLLPLVQLDGKVALEVGTAGVHGWYVVIGGSKKTNGRSSFVTLKGTWDLGSFNVSGSMKRKVLKSL